MNEMTMYEGDMPVSVRDEQSALLDMDYGNVLELAEKADKMVTALNKIMAAAIKITTERDWCMIGGVPYLQESGATKVGRLFGISWQILPGFPKKEYDGDGYPIITYRMLFRLGTSTIEAEGMRNGRDEFFTGKKDKPKSADEIDVADVQRSAYTNCLNRGIKSILPGLRNLDVAALEDSGLKVGNIKGYTFKNGSKGGNSGKATDSGLTCDNCGSAITQKVASYSQGKYRGHKLCMDCQKQVETGWLNLDKLDAGSETGGPPPHEDGEAPRGR